MSDVNVEHKEKLSREQAATWLHALSRALHKGGEVALPLGSAEGAGTTLNLRLPDEVEAEFEVEVDGAEVQLEVELTWSIDRGDAATVSSTEKESDDVEVEAADDTDKS